MKFESSNVANIKNKKNMKNLFLIGLFVGITSMGILGFAAVQNTTIFQPASPVVVSVKFWANASPSCFHVYKLSEE